MSHVFEGTPDARQSADQAMPTSRFRPRYRALADNEKALHDALKEKAAELEALINQIAPARQAAAEARGAQQLASCGRETALAMTKLEESLMWAVKGLTA